MLAGAVADTLTRRSSQTGLAFPVSVGSAAAGRNWNLACSVHAQICFASTAKGVWLVKADPNSLRAGMLRHQLTCRRSAAELCPARRRAQCSLCWSCPCLRHLRQRCALNTHARHRLPPESLHLLAHRSMDPLQLQHIPILPEEARAMLFVLVTPLFEAPTAEMRAALPADVPLRDAVHNCSQGAALMAGIFTGALFAQAKSDSTCKRRAAKYHAACHAPDRGPYGRDAGCSAGRRASEGCSAQLLPRRCSHARYLCRHALCVSSKLTCAGGLRVWCAAPCFCVSSCGAGQQTATH